MIAVDLQPQMIAGLRRRAKRAGLLDRIEVRVAPAATMNLAGCDGAFDFVLAFAVVHELPSMDVFFAEAARAMRSGASLLLAEPDGHVGADAFDKELSSAAKCGLAFSPGPQIWRSRSAILKKA